MTAWVVRAGAAGESEAWNLIQGRAGVGFSEVGDLTGCRAREDVRALVDAAYSSDVPMRQANITGQLWALRNSIAPGDLVVMPLKSEPGYLALGRCTSGYSYDAAQPDKSRRHHIRVQWSTEHISRSVLKDDLLNMVNGAMTVFSPSRNDAAARLELVSSGGADPGRHGTIAGSPTSPKLEDNSDEVAATVVDPVTAPTPQVIRDRVRTHIVENFSKHKMTYLVADILKVRGFRCDVSEEGPDGGVDILSGRGPLGLDSPTLVVEVKSDVAPQGTTTVRSLNSALNRYHADQGLLVAWGGVNGNARKELSTLRTTIRVWDADDLMDELFEVYPNLPERTRTALPMKLVWVLDMEGSEI